MKRFYQFLIAGAILVSNNLFAQTEFTQTPLNYSFSSLVPYIDSTTMNIHFSRHHAGYVKNLNAAVKGTEAASLSLEQIFANVSKYNSTIRNNAGGHYNHSLYWSILSPVKSNPSARLAEAIQEQFNGIDSLKYLLNKAASSQFGSGWAWLIVTPGKKLQICSTPNQDNPLMDIATVKGTPILAIDVWEHAYYLNYQNKRADYLTAIWNVINWNEVSRLYDLNVPKGKFDEWPEIKSFHKIMSQTFHPSEEGNLVPIKSKSAEMVEKAIALSKSKIPAAFNTKEVNKAISQLVKGSQNLDKLVKKNADDKALIAELNKLHDTFHQIMGLCTSEGE